MSTNPRGVCPECSREVELFLRGGKYHLRAHKALNTPTPRGRAGDPVEALRTYAARCREAYARAVEARKAARGPQRVLAIQHEREALTLKERAEAHVRGY